MKDQAITKLQTEMDKNKNNGYIQAVGQFLLLHVESHPEMAQQIMMQGKSIQGSLAEMRKAAEKKKSGNAAVLTDAEGFREVLQYYGIEGNPEPMPSAPVQAPTPKPAAAFDVNLEDLL